MFVKNFWYVAGLSNQIGRELTDRTLFNERVVIFRNTAGDPVILENRCPHRFAPLSKGKLIGDEVQCGYHGLRFNCSGQCTHVPTQDDIPARAVVKSYPSIDKYGFVWIWYGDPSLADESKLPQFDVGPGFAHATDPEWASCEDSFKPNVHYGLVIDNLLDLSHAPYVHENSFGVEDVDIDDQKMEIVVEGNCVHDRRTYCNGLPGPVFYGLVGDEKTPVDFWMDMHWAAPGNLLLETGVTQPGAPRAEGFEWLSSHMITPETDSTSHYFWIFSRNFDIENKELTDIWHKTVNFAFSEDEDILGEQQFAMGDQPDIFAHKPVLLKSDKSAAQARRIMSRLLETEQNGLLSVQAGAK